ncbi:MAG: TauD/TfdA family dioxygenase [Deltaproteobacteria bacterium]|nr:TauD/TfdA family dioxygenase [Deltaproteobacteria bacterium]MBW2495851.1 TauD/TfdA family dioxygenase [Deltaproteobacteria bacterium]
MTRNLQQDPLSERIGSLISGVDLRAPLDEATQEALRAAMRERKLLVFRESGLSVDDQIRLTECFGRVWDEKGDGSFHIYVSNNREGAVLGRSDGLLFHSDCVFADPPLSVISLYGLELPRSPSPTVFANAIEAVRDLPEEVRSRLDGARGSFVGGLGGYARVRAEDAPESAIVTEHPIRYPDRLAGERTLLIDELFFDRLIGRDPDESEQLRAEVHRHLYAERNLYEHHWQVGDLLVWDNLGLQHGRRPVPSDGGRTLRRVVGLESDVESYAHLTVRALEIEAKRG